MGESRTQFTHGITSQKSPANESQLPPHQQNHLPDSEAGDPDTDSINHSERRSTRLVHSSFDTHQLPKPLVECGCSKCTDSVDPLADESHVFRDITSAKESCPSPRPMTVERASEAYAVYQKASLNAPDRISELERTQSRHGRILGGDIELRDRMENPTLILLSLRVSPIHRENGRRQWIHPVTLDSRIADSWENVRSTLSYHLKDHWYEYVWITATTSSAATPHRHVLIYVDDPDDSVGIEVPRAAVSSFVNNTQGAEHGFHQVEPNQSDAGIIFHEVPTAEKAYKSHPVDYDPTAWAKPSVPIYYMANQQPNWALKNLYDGTTNVSVDSTPIEGAAIAWCSPNKWFDSSNGFPMKATG